MSAHHAIRVIIHHIIIILHVALHLRIATLVVGPQTVVDGPVACAVGDGSEALGLYALGVDAALPGDVVGILDMHVVPWSPRHGAVVHDEVLASVERQRTLAAVHALAATHADIADDDVLGIRGNDTPAVDGDTLAGSRLSGYGDVAGNGDALACDVYHAAYVEHNEAVLLAHGIGQRACPCCIEVGDVNHLSALCSWKR